jgi:hypothetical protein
MQADRESQSGIIQGVTEDTSVDEEANSSACSSVGEAVTTDGLNFECMASLSVEMSLFLLINETDLAHVMEYLAGIAFAVVLALVLLFALNTLAARARRSGKSTRRFPKSNKGQKRR